jgi:quinoprotein glucose dehydrogenase
MTMPRGDVRGYDVRSGALLWTFHTIPQDGEPGNETWQEDSWRYSGNTNVWTPMSADQDLGLAYLPLSTPTNDYYGGHRLGHNLYAESLVAVDCRSGERAWHFQAVHHGLWDYDFPAAATLVDLERDGATVQAVAQVSKQGFTYVFDRRTGEPLWPIEERAVPQSDVPGEVTSPTQPHPSKPPPFEMQGAAEENLIDWTPELRAEALEIFRRYRSGPLFSPPSVQGSFQIPGSAGGANWGGAAFDPESGLLFVPSITVPTLVRSFEADPNRSDFRYLGERIFSFTVGFGSGEAQGLTGPRGLPLFKPPYSRVTALDLHTGTLAWQVPTGDGPRQQVAAILGRDPGPLGSASRGHVLATKTLLFVTFAAPDETPALLVLDKQTGATVTSIALPAAPSSTPVTFLDGSGRQLVVVAIAGSPPSLLALALPD